jgi:hypothetical protein
MFEQESDTVVVTARLRVAARLNAARCQKAGGSAVISVQGAI